MVAINPQAVFTFLIILTAILSTFIFWLAIVNKKKRFSNLEKGIPAPQVPQGLATQQRAIFVDLSPKSADVVELAVEVWRINNRIMKVGNDLTDTQKRGLESSLQRFVKFLDRYDIKIIDHTGEKYNEGMNVDVLSFEKDQNTKTPTIKETIEPSIICKGHIIKKGKIIVTTN